MLSAAVNCSQMSKSVFFNTIFLTSWLSHMHSLCSCFTCVYVRKHVTMCMMCTHLCVQPQICMLFSPFFSLSLCSLLSSLYCSWDQTPPACQHHWQIGSWRLENGRKSGRMAELTSTSPMQTSKYPNFICCFNGMSENKIPSCACAI